MGTIQWRPEVNALTTPQSYWIRFVPKYSAGSADMARRLAQALPNYSEEEFRTFLATRNDILRQSLLDGETMTEEGAFIYSLSFTGRLDNPDDPLPPLEDCLQVRVRVSPPFAESLRQDARTERLPMSKKLPLINTAQDTVLELSDVLNPDGLLRLTGEDLSFDRNRDTDSCVIAGTASGSTVQTRFGKIEDSELIIMPDIPAQSNPWNNEYTVSVSTHYSEHGTLRTGTYGRMLRTPLAVNGFGEPTGCLTGSADAPYVTITSGIVSEDTRLRIRVIRDALSNRLIFSLIDMREGGAAGNEISVTGNGTILLPGYTDSAVTSLAVTVHNYAALWEMVRSEYSGRLTDILDITTA